MLPSSCSVIYCTVLYTYLIRTLPSHVDAALYSRANWRRGVTRSIKRGELETLILYAIETVSAENTTTIQ